MLGRKGARREERESGSTLEPMYALTPAGFLSEGELLPCSILANQAAFHPFSFCMSLCGCSQQMISGCRAARRAGQERAAAGCRGDEAS